MDLFFIRHSIQTVLSNDNDTLRKILNLDFSPVVSPGKQVKFSVETHKVRTQINPTPILYKAIAFKAQLVAVKALLMTEIYEL